MADRTPVELLVSWIGRRVSPDAMAWLEQKRSDLTNQPAARALQIAIGMVPRRMGKADLSLSQDDLSDAARARAGWTPVGWTVDQAARIVLLLGTAGAPGPFAERLQALSATSDVGELIAIYRGLPLYPDQPTLTAMAADGLRTAMRSVFESVAHHNPFPAEQFSESAWNHMVLKALFIESSLDPIQGLDRRWNPDLARTLRDYAHERWAAGRPVIPELWRGVGRFADDGAIDDLAHILKAGNEAERAAAALALSESDRPAAADLLETEPDLAADIRAGRIGWSSLERHPGQDEASPRLQQQ